MLKTFTTILLFAGVCAQMQAKKFHVDIDYHYSLGLYEKYAGESLTRGNYDMGGHALDLTFRYDVIKNLSVGAGIGLDRYTEPEYNTLPVYVTARYYPIEKVPHAYTYANLWLRYRCRRRKHVLSRNDGRHRYRIHADAVEEIRI